MSINKLKYNLLLILLLTFASCTKNYYLVSTQYELIEISPKTIEQEDTMIISIIKPYKIQLDSSMNEIINYLEEDAEVGLPEGTLNNLIADIILEEAKKYGKKNNFPDIDFCILNNGGLRKNLNKGNITIKDIYELMPFENEMVIVKMNGKDIKEIFNYLVKNSGGCVAGMSLGIKEDKSNYYNPIINNKPFDENNDYFIVTSDYLLEGGDKMYFFSKAIEKKFTYLKIKDLIIDNLKEKKQKNITPKPSLDKRLYYVKE